MTDCFSLWSTWSARKLSSSHSLSHFYSFSHKHIYSFSHKQRETTTMGCAKSKVMESKRIRDVHSVSHPLHASHLYILMDPLYSSSPMSFLSLFIPTPANLDMSIKKERRSVSPPSCLSLSIYVCFCSRPIWFTYHPSIHLFIYSCTDILCLAFFIVFIAAWIAIGAIGVINVRASPYLIYTYTIRLTLYVLYLYDTSFSSLFVMYRACLRG